jgi:predicted DsbA family dithiol-disulfide isomerase
MRYHTVGRTNTDVQRVDRRAEIVAMPDGAWPVTGRTERRVAVDLWIDPICPRCLIGMTQMERAAAALGVALDLRLRAFRLHPIWPADGMDWRQFQAHRDLPDAVFDRVAEAGWTHGLDFRFSEIARVPDTTDMHRLLIAAGPGQARALYVAFSDAYFFRRENLADPAILRGAAARGGLSRTQFDAALSDPTTLSRLTGDEAEARALGVTGVPFLRLGQARLSGAQGEGGYARLLGQVLASG